MKTRRILIPVLGFVAAAVLATVGGWFALGNVVDAQTDLTAPSNVRAVQGPGIGQAVVSWDAVAGATGYTVRWVDLDAAWAAYDADGRWGHLIESEDVQASGNDRHSLSIPNLKTNTTRGHAFAVRTQRDSAVSGWSDWKITRLTVEVDAEAPVEVLVAALAISRHASTLAATTQGGMTPDSLRQSVASAAAEKRALNRQLQALAGKGHEARVNQITTLANRLAANTDLILAGRPDLLRALGAEITSREDLGANQQQSAVPGCRHQHGQPVLPRYDQRRRRGGLRKPLRRGHTPLLPHEQPVVQRDVGPHLAAGGQFHAGSYSSGPHQGDLRLGQ